MWTEFDLTDGPVPLHITAGPPTGPPLVFWHGVGRRGTDFLPLLPALSIRWHVHLVDQRGHGQSGRSASYRVADHLDDALTLIRWLGRPAVHFGHSFGALVVAQAASACSELVLGAILEDPPSQSYLDRFSSTPYAPTFEAMRRLSGHGRSIAEAARDLGETLVPSPAGPVPLSTLRDAASLRFLARCLADVDGAVFTPALTGTWLDGYDESVVWKAIACPTLLLRGQAERGSMLPAADADRMAREIRDLTRIDVPEAGHLIHAMEPQTTLRHVLNFLESLL